MPLSDLKLLSGDDGSSRIEFVFDGSTWSCDLETLNCTRGEAPEEERRGEVKSPDGRWFAFSRDGNIFLRECASGNERQVTTDAEEYYGYGTLPEGRQTAVTDRLLGRVLKPGIAWSPDSTRLLTYRLDERNIKEMYLLQTATPDDRRPPGAPFLQVPVAGRRARRRSVTARHRHLHRQSRPRSD